MKPFRIDRGIKVPPVSHATTLRPTSRAVTTLNLLKKGDSFLVKDPTEAFHASKQMRDFLRRERSRNGTRVFVSRKVGAGIRFWRTQ